LLIQTPDANLSKGMRQLNGVFTQASNRRHLLTWVGPLQLTDLELLRREMHASQGLRRPFWIPETVF
jgi:hypothetical protein